MRLCLPSGTGSPPRAWGGLGRDLPHAARQRLTPTCVGRTSPSPAGTRPPSAHPHVRGEDVSTHLLRGMSRGSPPRAWGGRAARSSCRRDAGSPPRAWGGRRGCCVPAGRLRLTPTCVGRTAAGKCTAGRSAAHPHVRGEDHTTVASAPLGRGSPPRAWGGRTRGTPESLRKRLTPTCVGRTAGGTALRRSPPAHPHVRGEDGCLASP